MAMPSEFDDISLPPIYERSLIITQPQRIGTAGSNALFDGQNDRISTNIENNNERENTNPPNATMSLISMSRGFQTSPISPEYYLSNVEELEIQPVVDVSDAYNSNRQYRVRRRDRSETLFLATENSVEWQKSLLGSVRGLSLILKDASGAVAFTLTKGVSFGCVPGYLHKMTVETTHQLIGNIEQNLTCFGVNFSINDTVEQHNQLAAYINGPNMYCCCCTLKNANFQIISPDGTRQVASIMHQWDHLLVDYILLVTFPANMDVKLKSLILGAAFLLESLYFDR